MPPPYSNPFRPGAGHMPLYLAGRKVEQDEFCRLLRQDTIFQNLVLTGLRGVGKTVLLETLKPLAIKEGWLWVGTDLSEAASLSEEHLALRLLTDMSVVTSSIVLGTKELPAIGFARKPRVPVSLGFPTLQGLFARTPGLAADKLKHVLERTWDALKKHRIRGMVFAYDEAQNMSDHAARGEYPLSLMLEVFQSIQKRGVPFMLVLTGLPTLFPKLVEARTYSERMFHVLTLDRLNERDSRDALVKPIDDARGKVRFNDAAIRAIVAASGGYPYFIQFIGREAYDACVQHKDSVSRALIEAITRKLDSDFFMGRWSRATERQRQLLAAIARLPHSDREFSVQDVERQARASLARPFSKSQINQMFNRLGELGLIYKNRHGKYAFAVPLLGQFIGRLIAADQAWWKEVAAGE
jgi:hypothetical protein